MKAPVVALLGLALAIEARGAVRLRPSGGGRAPTVSITPARHGVWDAADPQDPLVLNPAGDLLGHGFPSMAATDSGVLLAWSEPREGRLALAIGKTGWLSLPPLAAEGIDATMAVAGPDGWMVAWQDAEGVHVSAVAPDGALSGVADLGPDRLIDARAFGSAVNVLSASSDGSLRVSTVVFISLPEPTTPPTILRSVRVGSMRTMVAGPGAGAAALDAARPLLAASDSRDDVQFVGWWASPSTLEFVALDEQGPVGAVRELTAPGRSRYSPALVQQALRAVANR